MKGSPPDHKGKKHFAPYSGFTPGTPVFNHSHPCQAEVQTLGKVLIKMTIPYKVNQDGYKKDKILSIYVTGGMFGANGTTSVPKSVPRLVMDKVGFCVPI